MIFVIFAVSNPVWTVNVVELRQLMADTILNARLCLHSLPLILWRTLRDMRLVPVSQRSNVS
jgi:hypothetical protein